MEQPTATYAIQGLVEKSRTSALIATANRGPSIVMTIESILQFKAELSELVIIDQSTNDDTYNAVQPFLHDSFINYRRVTSKGKGKALNAALELIDSEYVILTDDDTEVCANWVAPYVDRLTYNLNTVLVYGDVIAAPFDPTEGFIPVYHCGQDRVITSLWGRRNTRGIGANCAIRRLEVIALGGFDPEMGPGGDFRACIDYDLTVRCLVAGHHVEETPDSRVIHYGFRTHKQGSKLMYNAFHGIAAMHTKLIRAGHYKAIPCMMHEFFVYALSPLLNNLVSGKLQGLQSVKGFLSGIRAAAVHEFTAATMLFQANPTTTGSFLQSTNFAIGTPQTIGTASNTKISVELGGLSNDAVIATATNVNMAVSKGDGTPVAQTDVRKKAA